jgi:hypothetical protein
MNICVRGFTTFGQISPSYWFSIWKQVSENKYKPDQIQTKNSVALVLKWTILTERPLLVGEVSANFSGERVSRGQRNESPQPLISVF